MQRLKSSGFDCCEIILSITHAHLVNVLPTHPKHEYTAATQILDVIFVGQILKSPSGAAILDMQISIFFNFTREVIYQCSKKKS